ncbi:MAG: FAD-dependent oxidoreductase, partial [Bacillota bacterium]
MKIRIIGCTHAGTAAAVNAIKENPEADIVVYERNDNISFLSCGIALYVGDFIDDVDGLFYSSPEELNKLGVEAKMEHDVLNIDEENKKLKIEDLNTGKIFEDEYDKLIVTTGSWPIEPPIENANLENIQLSKNFNHANTIIEKGKESQEVVVVGAGYIGVELAESFERLGKKVTLIDAVDRIMNKYLDPEFTDVAENEF